MIQYVDLEFIKNRRNGNIQRKLFSELVLERRGRLAGHILRTSEAEPLRQVSCAPNSAESYPVGKGLAGGPRQLWLFYSSKYVWENVLHNPFNRYANTNRQNNEILTEAHNRCVESRFPRVHGLSSDKDYGKRLWHGEQYSFDHKL